MPMGSVHSAPALSFAAAYTGLCPLQSSMLTAFGSTVSVLATAAAPGARPTMNAAPAAPLSLSHDFHWMRIVPPAPPGFWSCNSDRFGRGFQAHADRRVRPAIVEAAASS